MIKLLPSSSTPSMATAFCNASFVAKSTFAKPCSMDKNRVSQERRCQPLLSACIPKPNDSTADIFQEGVQSWMHLQNTRHQLCKVLFKIDVAFRCPLDSTLSWVKLLCIRLM